MALDDEERAHISYCDNTNGDLKYAFKADSGWETATVDTYENSGFRTSMALDLSGNPHIGYLTYDTWSVLDRYAYKDNLGWHVSSVWGFFEGYVGGPSLALDAWDNPHMCFDGHTEDEADRFLCYATKPGAEWSIEIVDDADAWFGTSIDLDSADRPHVSYLLTYPNNLGYAYLAPDSVELNIEASGSFATLEWEPYPGAALYQIHGTSNDPYFFVWPHSGTAYLITTVPSSQSSWETANGIGDPDENWTFQILAKDETNSELARSNKVGEHDFALEYPE